MKPTRSARDTPASGQDGTSSHDNVPNVNQPTNVVSKSVPDSKVGTAHDSIQEVSQDAPPQRTPDISRKIARAKWRRYSPGFKVRAVRLTRANAEDGTRVGLRRAALVLGIRHDAIVVWQRHFDELRQQAIDNDEDVNEDLSDLIYKVYENGKVPPFHFIPFKLQTIPTCLFKCTMHACCYGLYLYPLPLV